MFETLLDINPLPVLIYDPSSFEIYKANAAAVNLFGYKKEELLQLNLKEIVIQRENGTQNEKLGSTHKKPILTTLQTKKKEVSKIEANEMEIEFNNSNCILLIFEEIKTSSSSTSLDLSQDELATVEDYEKELIKVKQSANEHKRRVREAQSLADLGSWYYDIIKQESQWSEETYKIWGLDPNIQTPKLSDHQKLVHPKDWDRFMNGIQDAIDKGIPYKMELELIRKDGSYKTVNTIGAPIFNENNQVIAFHGTTQDISDRINIENDLKQEKEIAEKNQYAMTQASLLAKIGYWNQDFVKNSLTWSNYIYKIYGLLPESTIPTYELAKSYFDKPSQEKLEIATKELLENGTAYDLELRLVNVEGEEVFIRKVMQPIYNNKNEIIGQSGVLQNITEEVHRQELNRDVAKMVKIGSWSVDLTEKSVYWSDELHEIHETDPNTYEPTLEECLSFFREDFRDMVNSHVENLIATGKEYDFEAIIKTANNNEVWIRSIGNAEFVDGKCTRLYGGLQNINTRKKAENNLLITSERLRMATASLRVGIWDWDVVKDNLTWDDRMFELYHVDRKEFKGKTETAKKIIHPEDLEMVNQKIRSAITGNEDFHSIYRIIWPDKSIRYIEGNAIVSRDENGRATRMIGADIDITSQKESEKDERFKASLLKTFGQAAVATNAEGIVTYWNKAAEHIYGWSAEEAIGKNVNLLTPSDVNEEQVEQILKSLREGQTWSGEFIVQKKDGTKFPVRVSNAPIYDEQNKFTGMIGISTDITEEVENKKLLDKYTNDLEKYNEQLRNIAWTQSHVVRAPLSRILGIINLIELHNGQLDDLSNWLKELKVSTMEMDEIVKKIVEEANALHLKH